MAKDRAYEAETMFTKEVPITDGKLPTGSAAGAADAGDRVTLTGGDGKDRTFEVVARKRYDKAVIPLTVTVGRAPAT